jgi:hypothetical protein
LAGSRVFLVERGGQADKAGTTRVEKIDRMICYEFKLSDLEFLITIFYEGY